MNLCHLTGCYDEMQPAFDWPKQQAMQRRWETAECCTRYWKERIHCWHKNPSSCKGSTDQRYIYNWFYWIFVYSTIKMNFLTCYRKNTHWIWNRLNFIFIFFLSFYVLNHVILYAAHFVNFFHCMNYSLSFHCYRRRLWTRCSLLPLEKNPPEYWEKTDISRVSYQTAGGSVFQETLDLRNVL